MQCGLVARASGATLPEFHSPRGFLKQPRRGGPLLAHGHVDRRSLWASIAPSSRLAPCLVLWAKIDSVTVSQIGRKVLSTGNSAKTELQDLPLSRHLLSNPPHRSSAWSGHLIATFALG